jgi:hypothetical protein
VNGVAFSPDGTLLATASFDQTVRLWEVATGQPHGAPLTGHTNAVIGVAFSPNGQLLATASFDWTVRLWNPFFHDWQKTGCHLVNRNLSMDEWNQLLPGVRYERTCPDLPAGQTHHPIPRRPNIQISSWWAVVIWLDKIGRVTVRHADSRRADARQGQSGHASGPRE